MSSMPFGSVGYFVLMLASRMPYFLVLVVGLWLWLIHPRRGTRGMNLLGMGILVELLLSLLSPVLSMVMSQMLSSVGAGMASSAVGFVLVQGLVFSLLSAVPMGLILYGAFTIARERGEEDDERDAEQRDARPV